MFVCQLNHDVIGLTDRQPITSLLNNWPIKSITRVWYYQLTSCDTTHFDSEDDYRTGCRNVSHCQQQQSYSGLCSPRRSYSTYLWNDSWVQTFHCFIELLNKSSRCSVWKSYNSLQICAKGTMWYVLAMKCTSGLSTMGCSTLGLVRNSYLFNLGRALNYLF